MDDAIYYPFFRQVKDWYRYSYSGNLYLEEMIATSVLDEELLKNAYFKLIAKRNILRSVFYKDNKGILLCQILPINDPRFTINIYKNTDLSFLNKEIKAELNNIKLSCGPLFKVVAYLENKIWYIKLYVHHMICEATSLEIIKNDFLALYLNPNLSIDNVYQFKDYVEYKNAYIIKSYKKDSSFFSDLGLPISDNSFERIDSLDEIMKKLNWDKSDTENVTQNTKSSEFPISSGFSYRKVFKIKDFTAIQNQLSKDGIGWNAIIMTCFSTLINKLYPQKKNLIGMLYNDRVSKYSINNVGEFSAECFLNTDDLTSTNFEKIKSTNLRLYKTFQHLIFNYKYYSIDEQILFRELCPMFVNFNIVRGEFRHDIINLNNFEEIDFIGCNMEPIVILYSNGYLLIHWKFNISAFTKIDMLKIVELLDNELHQFCSS